MIGQTNKNMNNLNPNLEKVVNSLIENVLNNPNFSWEKLWRNMGNGNSPYNPISGTIYSGMNRLILEMYASMKGCNQFATAKQIYAKGGSNKGAKSIIINKFGFYFVDSMTKIKYYKPETINNLPQSIKDRLLRKKYWDISHVFSLADCTNISFETPEIVEKNSPIEDCQKIIDNWECKINIGLNNEKAFYSPNIDVINMPHLQAFKNAESFYHVAFHEIAHSTGNKKRLNRDLSGMFGNDKYAKEELVAELSSVLISANYGILTDNLVKNTNAYLTSWTKRMTDKKAELFSALSHSMKAFDYILKVGS